MEVAHNRTEAHAITPDLIALPGQYQSTAVNGAMRWLGKRGVEPAVCEALVLGYRMAGFQVGVNWVWALCQSALETNFWKYTGDVPKESFNMAGIGATGNGERGESFGSLVRGIYAHVQYLALYAGVPIPKNQVESIRGRHLYDVILGRAEGNSFRGLANKWAADPDYYSKIHALVIEMEKEAKIHEEPHVPAPATLPVNQSMKGQSVLVSPGHSESDPGALGLPGEGERPTEYAATVLQANVIARKLRDAGASVVIMDPNPDNLRAIGRSAGDFDLFVEPHLNAFNADRIDEGTETYVPRGASAENRAVALAICDRISETIGSRNRGVKEMGFTAIQTAHANGCPVAVLIESFFIDAYSSKRLVQEKAVKSAEAAAQAIIDYYTV